MPIEAKSLASLINLASNPPAYPRNPTHEPLQPLSLYIVRVPGSRDVFLSPLKPGTKDDISPESLTASLYFLHVAGPEDQVLLEEIRHEAEEARNQNAEDSPDTAVRQSMRSSDSHISYSRNIMRGYRSSSATIYPAELEQLNKIRRKPVGSNSRKFDGSGSQHANREDPSPSSPVDPEVAEAAKAVLPYVNLKKIPEKAQEIGQQQQQSRQQLLHQIDSNTSQTASLPEDLQNSRNVPDILLLRIARPVARQTQQSSDQRSRPNPSSTTSQYRYSHPPLTKEQGFPIEQQQSQNQQLQELLGPQQEYQEELERRQRRSLPPLMPSKIMKTSTPPPSYQEFYQPKRASLQPSSDLPPRHPPALPPRPLHYDSSQTSHHPRSKSPRGLSMHSALNRGLDFDSFVDPTKLVDHEQEEQDARRMAEATTAAHQASKDKWNMTHALQAGKRLTHNLGRRATTGRRSRASSLGSESLKNLVRSANTGGLEGLGGNGAVGGATIAPDGPDDRLHAGSSAAPASRTRAVSSHRPVQSWNGHAAVNSTDPGRPQNVMANASFYHLSPGKESASATQQASLMGQQQQQQQQRISAFPKRKSMEWFRGRASSETQREVRNGSAGTHGGDSTPQDDDQPPFAPGMFSTATPCLDQKPYHITLIRRDPTSGAQWNVGTITNANPNHSDQVDPDDSISIEILTPGYRKFAGNSNPLALGRLGLKLDDLPPALKDAMAKVIASSTESGPNGDTAEAGAAAPIPPGQPQQKINGPLRFTRILSLQQQGHSRTDSQTQQAKAAGRYTFTSPWHGICSFTPGASGHTLKLRHAVTSVGAAGHLNYHRHHKREGSTGRSGSRDRDSGNERVIPMVVAEVRFNLPLLQPAWAVHHTHHGRGKSLWSSKPFLSNSGKDKSSAAAAQVPQQQQVSQAQVPNQGDGAPLSPVASHTTPIADTQSFAATHARSQAVDFSQPLDPDAGQMYGPAPATREQDQRMDLSLGRERAGGGMRGKSAKLGKLVLEDEGLKMMDLVVAACMGVWWNAYETIDV
ncbi:hypothetical protein KEM54_006101 [Ascosphaera aggregata]|nr:hypothetical protein KEM54_006101 [Ascosphaera aggregata]